MVKKVLKILLVMMIIILIIGIIGIYFVKSKIEKINYVEIEKENIQINEEVQLDDSYRNIALFGVDSRSDSYETGTRSDCIMVASINETTKDVKLFSIYRDTYLEIEGYGLDKITHAYSYGGAELALSTINRNMDLNITEFIAVNFSAVIEIINSIGGIEIEITTEELKYINDYISHIDQVEKTKTDKITQAGIQNLNGVQALAYSRIRYTEGGDYKRTERIRDVVSAALKKSKTLNISELNKAIDTILPKIYTNINSNEILQLIPEVIKYNINESIGWPYQTEGITLDRWYGVPITLESNVIKLHQEIFNEPEYIPSQTVKEISEKIIKKTGYK